MIRILKRRRETRGPSGEFWRQIRCGPDCHVAALLARYRGIHGVSWRMRRQAVLRVEPSVFGSFVRLRRTMAGLTQEELAERAGISVRTVSDLERGVIQHPHPLTARTLAQALELAGDDQTDFLLAAHKPASGGPDSPTLDIAWASEEDISPGVAAPLVPGALRARRHLPRSRSRLRIAVLGAIALLVLAGLGVAGVQGLGNQPPSAPRSLQVAAAWEPDAPQPVPYLNPTGIAVGPKGIIYIADQARAVVLKVSPTGTLLGTLRGSDPLGVRIFGQPVALAVGGDGTVYITVNTAYGFGNQIDRFSPSGAPLSPWLDSSLVKGDPLHSSPIAMAADRRGHLYGIWQVPGMHPEVLEVAPSGQVAAVWGPSGRNPSGRKRSSSFVSPRALALDPSGTLYILDVRSGGPWLSACPQAGACMSSPIDSARISSALRAGVRAFLAADGQGHVALALGGRVESVYDVGVTASQKIIGLTVPVPITHARIPGIAALAVGPAGTLYVAHGGTVSVVTLRGTLLAEWGNPRRQLPLLHDPLGVAVAPNGDIYATDTGEGRILKLGPESAKRRLPGGDGRCPRRLHILRRGDVLRRRLPRHLQREADRASVEHPGAGEARYVQCRWNRARCRRRRVCD